jgi:hypothetical protein
MSVILRASGPEVPYRIVKTIVGARSIRISARDRASTDQSRLRTA